MTKLPPLLSDKLLTTQENKYSPEQFGLNREEVYDYRTKLFTDDSLLENGETDESNGLFLYKRRKINDPTGKECGGYYFSQVPGDGDYSKYITEEEKKIFTSSAILKILAKYNVFIEYGPGLGDANKLRKWVLENRQFSEFRKKYIGSVMRHIGLDISGYTSEQFTKEYMNNKSIHGECIPTEWSKSNIPKDVPNAAHVMLGGTPGAYMREQLIQLIKSFSSGSHFQKSPLLLSFFSAPTEPDKQEKIEQIKNAYRCNAAKQFVMKGIESLGIPIDSCEYVVQYQEGTGKNPDRIRVGAQLKKDITIDVGGGKQMTKKAGEHIWSVSSRRYTDEQFKDVLKEAGMTAIKLHGDGGIKVAESYLPRKKFTEKVRKRAKNIGLIIAGTAALTYGMHEWGKYSKLKDAREYAMQEMAYKNIEHPLRTFHQRGGVGNEENTNYNATTETREERLVYITDNIYDIARTEYMDYDFPNEDIVKAAIMRYIPEYTEYFTHSKGPDKHFFAFVNHVLMPHLFASFGNQEQVGLYSWMDDEEIKQLMYDTRMYPGDFNFYIHEFQSDQIMGDRTGGTKSYDVTHLGEVYIPTDCGEFKKNKLGYVTIYKDATMGHGRAVNLVKIQFNKFLIAGDDESGYSVEQARKVVEFVDEKGYAGLLTDKIMHILDPAKTSPNKAWFTKNLYEYIVSLNKQGYDLSWFCRNGKEKELQRFVSGFLLTDGSPLCNDIYSIVAESGVSLEDTESYSEQLDRIMAFLNTYYGQRHFLEDNTLPKNTIGARNFLIQVLLSNYFANKNLQKLTPFQTRGLLQRLNKLNEYGYHVQFNSNGNGVYYALEELYKNYDAAQEADLYNDFRIPSDLNELYIGNVIFTSDGKGWIVRGRGLFPAAFALTQESCYIVMKEKMPVLLEQKAKTQYNKNYNSLSDYEKRMTNEFVLRDLSKTVLRPTTENAYIVAKDLHKHPLK